MTTITCRRTTLLAAVAVLLLLVQPVAISLTNAATTVDIGAGVVHAQGGGGDGGGGAGIFSEALTSIQKIARDAWMFLTGLLIVVALLGGLWYTLQGTAGAAFGGSRMVSVAVVGGVGLVVLVLIAFMVLPELGDVLKSAQPEAPF